MKITVIGAGSFGTSIAYLLNKNRNDVTVYIRNKEAYEYVIKNRKNKRYLKELVLDKSIKFKNDLEESLKDSQVIVITVPSTQFRNVINSIKKYISNDVIVVGATKGIENTTLSRLSLVADEILPNNPYVCISGPSHAEEISLNIPTVIVSSSKDKNAMDKVAKAFHNETFKVYMNEDIIGVELGGSLKNIYAIGAGILSVLSIAGDNAKAAYITRAIAEMRRAGKVLGANPQTFSGLSGIGDLIVTCTSEHSRNFRFGVLIGKGYDTNDALEEIGMAVEGLYTLESAKKIIENYNLYMPIVSMIYDIIFEKVELTDIIKKLSSDNPKSEFDYL